MRFVPLRVSCSRPVLRLVSAGGEGGGPAPASPCLALGRLSLVGRACVPGAVWCLEGCGGPGGPLGGGRPVLNSLRGAVGHRACRMGSRSSVPLSPLHRYQGWPRRRWSRHGGLGLHTAPVRVRVLPPRRRPGGRHGAAWSPGGQPVGQVGSLEAPQPLEGPFTSMHAFASRLPGVTGRQGGEGKGACGAWTRLSAWRGSRGRGGGGSLPTCGVQGAYTAGRSSSGRCLLLVRQGPGGAVVLCQGSAVPLPPTAAVRGCAARLAAADAWGWRPECCT